MLNDLVRCDGLFHTAIGTAFADIMIDSHREIWPIHSKRFRSFLRRSYYEATGEAASVAEIRSTLDLLEARAQFDGPSRAVHVASPSVADTSMSISLMSAGAPSTLALMDGA